jgi:hypothetical protein
VPGQSSLFIEASFASIEKECVPLRGPCSMCSYHLPVQLRKSAMYKKHKEAKEIDGEFSMQRIYIYIYIISEKEQRERCSRACISGLCPENVNYSCNSFVKIQGCAIRVIHLSAVLIEIRESRLSSHLCRFQAAACASASEIRRETPRRDA